jgi:HORMA domain-containing protein
VTTSFTRSATATFSLSSARYVASKIATDLCQLRRYYGTPTDTQIAEYAEEAAILTYHGYVEKVIYGFQRGPSWILTLEYTVVNGTLTTDDRAGGVYRRADVAGAVFHSYMNRTPAWRSLTDADRNEINKTLPFTRTPADAPGYIGGHHTFDRTYSAQGAGFTRSSYRPL